MKNTISILLLVASIISMAQSQREAEYAAYLKSSIALWKRCISQAEKEYGAQSFEKGMAMYGLLNSTMATKDKETFKDNVDQTIDLFKIIIEEKPDWGEPKAALSAIYGLVIANSPMKGMFYGVKSSSLADQAINNQSESPFVHKVYGGSKLYTPAMFGGDADEAASALEKAIAIYEQNDDTENNWLYLESLVNLSMAYQKIDKTDMAKKTLEKSLELEPEYGWAMSILSSLNE